MKKDRISFDDLQLPEHKSIEDVKKSKGGRPPKKSAKLDKKMIVYFTAQEHEEIMQYCEETGIPISRFIRKCILKTINK